MKVIMTCGGTGGHIYPAIAIADKIKDENPGVEIIFIGTGRPLERQAIPGAGYELRVISARGFYRRRLYRNLATFKNLLKGLAQAGEIIKEVNPLFVIGTGGYVCVPVIMKAHQMGIRTYIHEQNARPGMANRWLESRVDKVFLGFQEAAPYFKKQKKIVVTGNPTRKSFGTLSRTDARNKLEAIDKDFVVLIFGGSLGAGMINKATIEALPFLLKQEDISIYFITGSNYYKDTLKKIEEMGFIENTKVKILEYAQNMDVLLAAADLVVSRAGALTLAEEAIVGIPAILIPSPNVTGNHQFYNAKAVSDKGGAVILEEKELSGLKLAEEINNKRQSPDELEKMKNIVKQFGSTKSVETIYEQLDFDMEARKKGKIIDEE